MKLKIYQFPEEKQKYIGEIDIRNMYTTLWYNEMMRRFKEDDWDRFDIDESYELWQISLNHLLEMLKFIKWIK